MKITGLYCSLIASICMAAFAGIISASGADLSRASLDDDWRFIKGDPAGLADNLAYPRAPRTGRGRGGVSSNTPAFNPASGIAEYILPTGNNFIADPARRFAKPDGN